MGGCGVPFAATVTAHCTIMFGVRLEAHASLEDAASAGEEVVEGSAEVPVKMGIDDGITEAVGVAEPQEDAAQPVGKARSVVVVVVAVVKRDVAVC